MNKSKNQKKETDFKGNSHILRYIANILDELRYYLPSNKKIYKPDTSDEKRTFCMSEKKSLHFAKVEENKVHLVC